MNEGKDENHPKDGEDTVCRVAPVEDGVDVGFIRQVGAATLDVGEVGHHVDQAEQLDVVQVETAPGPAEEISVTKCCTGGLMEDHNVALLCHS